MSNRFLNYQEKKEEKKIVPDPFHKVKFPRCREDSPNWNPAWRYIWTEKLLDSCKTADGKMDSEKTILPQNETDPYIRNYFLWSVYGYAINDEDTHLYNWAYETHANNSSNLIASYIKACLVGKLSKQQIAATQWVTEAHIDVYLKLFFDIEKYIDDSHYIQMKIIGNLMSGSMSCMEQQEKEMMSYAVRHGPARFDKLIRRDTNLTQEEANQLLKEAKDNSLFALHRHFEQIILEPMSAANHLSKANEFNTSQSVSEQLKGDSKSENLLSFIGKYKEKLINKAIEQPDNPKFLKMRPVELIRDAEFTEKKEDFLSKPKPKEELDIFGFPKKLSKFGLL